MTAINIKNGNLEFPLIGIKKNLKSNFTKTAAVGSQIDEKQKFLNVMALKNLNLEFNDGDKVGLLGHNGSGKSTLLKLIAGIYPLKTGSIDINGKIQTLLHPDAGLEPEENGLRNIKRLALLLNFDYQKVESNINSIIENSELGDYIHFPVKTYSDGMKLRLYFALITSYKSDIFLIDEFLSVGDENFHRFAKEKLNNIFDVAPIVLIASHNIPYVQELVNRVIVLNSGEVIFDGDTNDGISFYKSLNVY